MKNCSFECYQEMFSKYPGDLGTNKILCGLVWFPYSIQFVYLFRYLVVISGREYRQRRKLHSILMRIKILIQ